MKTNFSAMGFERFAVDKQIESATAAMEAALISGNMGEAAERRRTLETLQSARTDMTWSYYALMRKEFL